MLSSMYETMTRSKFLLGVMVGLLAFTLASPAIILSQKGSAGMAGNLSGRLDLVAIQEEVVPLEGRVLPIRWGDLGKRMLEDGVIAEDKLARPLYGIPSLPPRVQRYLDSSDTKQIELNHETAGFWLEALWGLGLANQNALLEKGPMTEDTSRLASTAGYEAGTRKGMDLYDKFSYIKLPAEQQEMVEDIASHIYRPCCANPASFPDCNHGMAVLGLIELMVSQGTAPDDIYQAALAFNSYWFPQTYQDIAYFYHRLGIDYQQALASEILSQGLSSGPGYNALHRQLGNIPWPNAANASGC